jgi:hypothetical protein
MFQKLFKIFRKPDPQVGELYDIYSDSPFEPKPMGSVKIVAVKDGWVKYQYTDGLQLTSSMRVDTFHRVYVRHT